MRCPNCGSENTQFVTNTTQSGPSFSKGCCGWLIFGPMGILCSFCGRGSYTEEYWICNSCGKKFQAGDYESELRDKTNRVERLKQDIASLEEELKNKPENLPQLMNDAKADYDRAVKTRDDFKQEFINSSSALKTAHMIYRIAAVVAVIIVACGIIMSLSMLGGGGLAIILLSIVIGIAMFGGIETIFDKKKQNVDAEKAEQLKALEEECNAKKAKYKELKGIQRKIDSYKQKTNELIQTEQELNNYQNNQNNHQ